jgi:hypothetical protein
MLRRPWLIPLLFVALTFSSPAQQVDASAILGSTPLDVPWRIHFGDDPAYAQPGFDDSHWTLHSIDQDWARAGRKGYAGYAWYRVRVILPKGSEPLAIAIYPPANAVEVYIDGALAGTIGRMRPEPVYAFLRTAYEVDMPAALHGRSVELALRTWESPLAAFDPGAGAAVHPSQLGTAGDVGRIIGLEQQNQWVAVIPDWSVHLIMFAVGLFSFGLFLLQRQAREYAYAAVCLCGFAVSDMLFWVATQTGASVKVTFQTDDIVVSILFCFWLLFTWGFVGTKADRLLYVCLTAAWMVAISSTVANLGLISIGESLWIWAAAFLFLSVAVFVRLYALARHGNRDAQLFLIPFCLWTVADCVIGVVYALRSSGVSLPSRFLIFYHNPRFDITWQDFCMFLSCFAIAAVLVLRFTRSAKQEQRLRAEMESARTVQQILVPDEVPTIHGFSIQAVYHPAGEVGGDFYQVLPTPGGGLLAVIGDVSGKGMPAAMTVSLLVGTVRTLAHYTQDPAAILAAMNHRMIGRGSGFTTCLVLRLDPDGSLTAANAGHIAPYANGKELDLSNALPLGITAAAEYSNATLQLEAGTTLTLLTDGVVEAQNAKGELFGFERAAEISSKPAQGVAEAAKAFGQEDDITVLTLGFAPAEVSRA